MSYGDLTAIAQDLIGPDEQVTAAGVFALQDNYKAITGAAVAESIVMPDNAGGLLQGVGTIITLEAARHGNAAAHGVTERMLVAVTDTTIHVFAMSAMGGKVERELMTFPRESSDVVVKKFGLSRHVNITERDSGQQLHLTGSTARISPEAKGDKAVLEAL
ncbi:MAG: hypothetical protein OEV60_07200 [Actinomycetota bacterium]|nr:hypothetical protein [Actinomycetota bacterium]MDH5312629.1 hypothetical protein [Actinomycetota bacterium]